MGSTTTGADPDRTTWPPRFRGGPAAPLAFLLTLTVLIVGANLLAGRLLGPDTPTVVRRLGLAPFDVVTIALAVAVLRYEGVSLDEVGLASALAAPGLVAFGAVVVALNVVAVALVALAGGGASPGFFYDHSAVEAGASIVSLYVFAALAEELAVRAYLQNRLIALAGGRGDRLRTAAGVVAASATFAALHVPRFVVDGLSPAAQAPALALLLFTGLGFGLVYELTHNLYFVTLLHGLGNYWLLAVRPAAWPNWPAVVVVYVVVIVAYRRWAADTTRRTLGVPG